MPLSRHPNKNTLQNPNPTPLTHSLTERERERERGAMEDKAISKKRRRSAAPSAAASAASVITRSRSSEVFFHRNRSGRARPDPQPYLRQCYTNHQSTCPKISVNEKSDGRNDNDTDVIDIGVTSVKDLRWRRVFSPALSLHSEGEEDDAKIAKIGIDLGLGQERVDKDSGNVTIVTNVEIGNAEMEEFVQTTPPDDEALRKLEKNTDRDAENDGCRVEEEKKMSNHLNERNRLGVVAAKSRMKLFKNPSSFSYRRLLPFLMDLAKDNSNTLEIHPCKKFEKAVEEKHVVSLINQPKMDNSLDNNQFRASDAPTMQSNETISMSSADADSPNSQSHEQPIGASPDEKMFEMAYICGNSCPVIGTQFNSPDGSVSLVQPSMADDPSESGSIQYSNGHLKENDLLVKSASSPLLLTEPFSAMGDASEAPYNSSEVVEDIGSKWKGSESEITPDVKPSTAFCVDQYSAHMEVDVPLESLLSSVTRGILKRHPRGCRGICNCINCASFRLHAERAFEFSRNQLQDAEEVVVELTRELSGLRSLLEKSVNGNESHALSGVSEVSEACRKASGAENLAKGRIREMKLELSIHCRTTCLERPRVKFSDVEPLVPKTLDFESQFK
ncbi:hypothetical protein Scep_010710 [Stephania cephalantha]|uniref:Uncharacterized protein n=1 Tax=Stephania cephalantha TaxID=152367 RepID=A0AAP0JWB6_9MAGN